MSPRKKSAIVECSFFIPIRGDDALSDGANHAPEQWDWLIEELWSRFGGATQSPGTYTGFYRDPDTGLKVTDESRRFTVAVPENQLNALRALMVQVCAEFFQKCIYLSVAGKGEFIERSSK